MQAFICYRIMRTSLMIYEAFGRLSTFCPGCGSAGLPTHHQCHLSFNLMFLCTFLHGDPPLIMTCFLLLLLAYDDNFI